VRLGARLARLERAIPTTGCEGCRGPIQFLTLGWDEPEPPLPIPCRCASGRIVRIVMRQPRPWPPAAAE